MHIAAMRIEKDAEDIDDLSWCTSSTVDDSAAVVLLLVGISAIAIVGLEEGLGFLRRSICRTSGSRKVCTNARALVFCLEAY